MSDAVDFFPPFFNLTDPMWINLPFLNSRLVNSVEPDGLSKNKLQHGNEWSSVRERRQIPEFDLAHLTNLWDTFIYIFLFF